MHRDDALPTLPLTIDPGIAPRIRVGSFSLDGVSAGDRSASLRRGVRPAGDTLPATLEGTGRRSRRAPSGTQAVSRARNRPLQDAPIVGGAAAAGASWEGLVPRQCRRGCREFRLALLAIAGRAYMISRRFCRPWFCDSGRGGIVRGIRKDQVDLGLRPTLVDVGGPFGNPTSDSLRTSVTGATRRSGSCCSVPRIIRNRYAG